MGGCHSHVSPSSEKRRIPPNSMRRSGYWRHTIFLQRLPYNFCAVLRARRGKKSCRWPKERDNSTKKILRHLHIRADLEYAKIDSTRLPSRSENVFVCGAEVKKILRHQQEVYGKKRSRVALQAKSNQRRHNL